MVILIDETKFGNQIYERRKAQGLTQEQLGKELGVSSQAISKWENGESLPDTSLIPDICKALSVEWQNKVGRGIFNNREL